MVDTVDKDPLLKPQEVVERLNVDLRTLATWRHGRKGPEYLKLGGLVRYRTSVIEKFIEDSRRLVAEGGGA